MPPPPAPTPPAPAHFLRSHTSPISALAVSDDNERIYSADASGKVVVTSTRSLRAITAWNPHSDSILGVEEWEAQIVTHGRDNKLHVWTRIEEMPSSARLGGSAALPSLPTPTLCYSMDVNALNYCRFSLLKLREESEEVKALIALPNLVDSSVADIWSLPQLDRIHAAIGQDSAKSIFSPDAKVNKSGIIMSMHLFYPSADSSSPSTSNASQVHLMCAYEDGGVTLGRYTQTDRLKSVQGAGWEAIWSVKLHTETIMAMRVSKSSSFALTVSADHIVGYYDLTGQSSANNACTVHRTKHAGNGSIAIRDDGKICAIGGWDGRIRLYSTRTFKPLGTLKYHKSACQCVEFARAGDYSLGIKPRVLADEDDDEFNVNEKEDRTRWLLGGGKDNRVTVWSLISFEIGM